MNNIEMREIAGHEGQYSITPDGRVWSHKDQIFRIAFDKGTGYWVVGLYDRQKKKTVNRPVHQLVAEAYIPKPDWWTPGMKLDVGHKDDDRSNNNVDNLYWCTRSENLNTEHYREAHKVIIRSKVRCVETGDIFPSIKAAGEWLGKNRYGINLCLLGKQKTCGGYHWERVFDDAVS